MESPRFQFRFNSSFYVFLFLFSEVKSVEDFI